LNQSTHSAVASSTSSMVRQGLRGLISSVLYSPLIVSARALMLLYPSSGVLVEFWGDTQRTHKCPDLACE
jgi:hypothetical protein